ncbi:MAG: spore cortex-lytic enzyme [Bacillota bacterium]
MKTKVKFLTSLVISFILILAIMTNVHAVDLGYRSLKFGNIGADVKQLQSKLQTTGYYYQQVDGIYGHGTEQAVIKFQQANNLRIDGISGYNTIRNINRLASQNDSNVYYVKSGDTLSQIAQKFNISLRELMVWNNIDYNYIYVDQELKIDKSQSQINNYNYSSKDLDLLTRAVYSEARGEKLKGKVAVAAVILNRVESSEFPDQISGVIFQPWAFTAVHDGQFWLTPEGESRKAVELALQGWDPSHGATFYYNPAKVTSNWIYTRQVINIIGKHYFAS